MKFLSHLLVWVISVQVILAPVASEIGPRVVYAAESDSSQEKPSKELGEAQMRIERLAQELDAADEGTYPRSTQDVFRLTGQKLEIVEGKTAGNYALDDIRINLPVVIPPQFDRDVQVEVDEKNKSLSLVYTKKGEVVARHRFAGIRAYDTAYDSEILTVLDESGKVLAIDTAYARNEVFRSPIPVFEIAELDPAAIKAAGEKISVEYVNRKMAAPTDADKNRVWTAGDLLISGTDSKGKKTEIQHLERVFVQQQLYLGESTAAVISTILAAPSDAESAGKLTAAAAMDEKVSERANQGMKDILDGSAELDPSVRRAFTIAAERVAALTGRSQANMKHQKQFRDRFLGEELLKGLNDAASEGAAVQPQAEAPKTPIADRVKHAIQGKSMKILAAIAAVGAAGVGAAGYLSFGPEEAWGVQMMIEASQTYMPKDVMPEVLRDPEYRITLLKSSMLLWSPLFILPLVGKMVAKSRGLNWTAKKMIATLGMRTFGAIQLPFWHHMAKLLRQPNLIPMLQNELSAFTRIRANSDLGRKLGLKKDMTPAFTNPVGMGEKDAAARELKVKAIGALTEQKARQRALIWGIASVAASQNSIDKFDPATILTQAMNPTVEDLNDPEFIKRRAEVAYDLADTFKNLGLGRLDADLAQISPESLEQAYKSAKAASEKIQARKSRVDKAIGSGKLLWKRIRANGVRSAVNFGLEENKFLMRAEPTEFVQNQVFRQFVADYSLAVGQMAVIGDRAVLSKPEDLAASEKEGLLGLYTNPGHRMDMIDQVRIYMINLPGNYALVFQKNKAIEEGKYAPAEYESLKGVETQQRLGQGVIDWFKSAGNLVQAGYGYLWWKDFVKRTKSIQAGFIMVMIGRMFFAGQPFGDALGAFGLWQIWGKWQYGWLWDPINKGNEGYGEKFEALSHAFRDAKAQVGQGSAVGDVTQTVTGYVQLMEMYKDVELPEEVAKTLIETKALMELPQADLDRMQSELNLDIAAVKKLTDAMAARSKNASAANQDALTTAMNELRARYGAAFGNDSKVMAEILQLNAQSLLDFALETPPYATKAHPAIEWGATLFGAVVTTYWATTLSVVSFQKDIPWVEWLLFDYAPKSAALYGGFWLAQKYLIDPAFGGPGGIKGSMKRLGDRVNGLLSKGRCDDLLSGK